MVSAITLNIMQHLSKQPKINDCEKNISNFHTKSSTVTIRILRVTSHPLYPRYISQCPHIPSDRIERQYSSVISNQDGAQANGMKLETYSR